MFSLNLERLFYVSRAPETHAHTIISDILKTAQAFNSTHDVTGLLTYDGSHFTQVLEGPADIVHKLMARIRADIRHTDVRILHVEKIRGRFFEGWAMNYLFEVKLLDEVAAYFDDESMARSDVIEFIEELREYALIVR